METIWASVHSLNYKGRYYTENKGSQRDFKSLRKWWKFEIIVGMKKMGNDQNKSLLKVIVILIHNADSNGV